MSAASFLIEPPAGLCGASSMSDLSGNIAISSGANTSDARNWATYDRTGARLGALHMFSKPIPRKVGFFGLDVWSGPDPRADAYHLWTFEPDGSGPSQSVGNYLCNSFIYRSSAGGVILTGTCGAGNNIASRVVWYDDPGAEKWRTSVDAYPVLAAVGDSAGNVLTAAQSSVVRGHSGNDLLGQWIAPDGKIASDWFVLVAGEEAAPTLQAMIGGGAFVMQTGRWVAAVPPMGRPQPPPDWLVARPEQDLRIVRGRKAYAFTARIPQRNGIPGGPMVEVVTPTGKSCGTFDTKGIAATVGADGTVIATTSDSCTRRVWPSLLGAR